jgi:F-type H+-transporting ATPase subunit b
LSSTIPAQEPRNEQGRTEEQAGDKLLSWKLINFAILVFALGYFSAKALPPFFRSRTGEIRSGIEEAAKMKAEAEAKVSEIERQLAGIGADIENLRSQLKAEMTAEGERLKQETGRLVNRIHEQAEQEINFMTKAGRQELKNYSASLALDLAKQRIQSRMNPDAQHSLVESFVSDLRKSDGRGNGR